MKNVGELIFEQREGEEEAEYAKRVQEAQKVFKNALGTGAGKQLLELLSAHSPPLAPRFDEEGNPVKAAFLDGERHLIGLMVMHSGHNV